MKKFLLILLLPLFLAGGAAAAWWFLLRGDAPESAEEESAPDAKPVYLDMAQMAIPVIRADGTVRTFILELSLEVTGEESATAVTELMPRLQDKMLVTLHELLARRFVEDSGYDQELIKRHLVRAARQTAGEGRIGAVLIRAMEQHGRG
jgi:flagellar basal body-associated protein FliL